MQEKAIENCLINGKCNNKNFQFQENAIVQWVLEVQGEALDTYGIWDRPYYDYCNSFRHIECY